jgi:hypothetical protein
VNTDLAKLIVDSGVEVWGYLWLRAKFSLGISEFSEREINEIGGESYLNTLQDSGLIDWSKTLSYQIEMFRDGSFLGFQKDKIVVPEKRREKRDTFLDRLLEHVSPPPDIHNYGVFYKKYPSLLSKLKDTYTEDQILQVAKSVGKDVTLNQLLTKKMFDYYFREMEQTPQNRGEQEYTPFTGWENV